MVSLLKNLFSKKELTDAELFSLYNKSEKTIKDFEIYIMNIKEGKESIALKEISGLKISSINEVEQLIEILEKNNINKVISLATNRDKKKLSSIYNQLKQINYIKQNFLQNDDKLIHFIYSNKYDLFTYLRKNSENNQNLLNYLYETYFTQQNYLISLEYFLLKDSENDIKFLLPNEYNFYHLQKNEAIKTYINLSEIFFELQKENDNKAINEINNLLLNLLIYFYTYHKDEIISKNLAKYLPKNNIEYIEIILSLYGLALKLDSKLTLQDFLKNELQVNFKKISMAEYSTFCYVLNNIISNVKEYSNTYRGLKFLPLEILREMIKNKAKYELLIKAIDIILNSNLYNNIIVFNFSLKYLFDFYCFNKVSLNQLNKIVKYLTRYDNIFDKITNQLESLLNVGEIFERYNIKFAFNELIMKDNLEDISKDNMYIKLVIEYLSKILENNIDNNKQFNFNEKNIKDLNILINYKKELTFGKLLIYYFDLNQAKRTLILNLIYANKDFLLSNKELKCLIDLYLSNPYLIQPEECDFIEQYLDEQGNMMSGNIYIKLEHLLEYLKIKRYIKKYNINDEFFKDYTLDNYSENIPKIVNFLLIKATKIEEIEDINVFLNSQQSEDIKNSLKFSTENYLYHLFMFLMEFKRDELGAQIIKILIKDDKNPKYFNKCLDYIYSNIFQKNNEEFRKYCKQSKIEDYIIENNNKYLDIIIGDVDFSKIQKISFPLQRQSNDILILYSLIKQKRINSENNKMYKDLFLSYNEYTNGSKEQKNMKNLIEIYYKNKDEYDLDEDSINYNYSLHPKLIELLKNKNYFHLFQDLNITFKTKIQIYNFCINNNICSLNDIINNFEIIKLKKKAKSDKDIIEKFKLFFNLYKEKDESKEIYKELNNFIIKNYDTEQKNRNALLLIDFNLSNKMNISFNNLIFLNVFFEYKITSDETDLKLLKLLSSSSYKINILPFDSKFNDNYSDNKFFQEIMEKYYKNNINISVKENNKFFESLKAENIYYHPNIYYQSLELFKILNISNIFTIREIYTHLNEKGGKKINIDLIFILNLIINFMTSNCIIPKKIDYGLKNILVILNNLDLSLEEINFILEEIFFFQSISFINNSCHNILLYNHRPEVLLRNFMEGKMKIAKEIIKMYYDDKINNILLKNNYKIFLVKDEIIKTMRDNIIINMYNVLRYKNDLKEIIEEINEFKELKEKVYEIYNT